jgi:hypothetical protein
VSTYNNKSQKALFSNLSANSQGQLVFTIQRVGTFNYLNGFSISESSSTVARVNNTGGVITEAVTSNEDLRATSLSVSPNPVASSFVLSLNNNYRGPIIIRVVNSAGKIVQQFRLTKGLENIHQTCFLRSNLVSGNYNIVVIQGKKVQTVKVIKL